MKPEPVSSFRFFATVAARLAARSARARRRAARPRVVALPLREAESAWENEGGNERQRRLTMS
jgi:hypothetical protein